MNILGILIICVGAFAGSTIRFKRRRNYVSIFKLDVVIISAEKKRDDNPSNSNNNKDYRKVKVSKPNKYHGE